MRHGLLHRLATLLLATWFLVGWGELLPVHDCPMHQALAPMAGMAHHDSMAMSHDAGDTPAPAHECTCPGKCAAVSGSAAAPSSVVEAGMVPHQHDVPAARAEHVRPRDVAHRLPFAIGPPA